MASLDNLEGDAVETVGVLVAAVIAVAAVAAFMGWRNMHLPVQLYPVTLFGNTASTIDRALYYSPLRNTQTKTNIDHVLGGISYWLVNNTPNPAKSPLWAAYEAANPATFAGDSVNSGNTAG